MPRHLLISLIAAASFSSVFAEARPWKSADGTRTIQGEFVKRDATSVTIKTDAGKELTIEFTKLHSDDVKWLDTNQPIGGLPPAADPTAFFDNLTFKDTRETALKKLKVSKLVEMTADEAFIGRSGLNGVFKTRAKIGALDGFLYFDWTEAGKLKELTLQTDLRPESDYKSVLEPGWKQLGELLTGLYGKPLQKGPLPGVTSLTDGMFSPSHLWKIEGGSALLGTARDGARYQLVVRFTQKKPQIVEVP
ncbi:hypothetical protein JIN84_21265 [Luteolibacter yonseiensis]|uniref:SLA1 homology domain-containing protein n=1 Tax=Luteolibacter yonseiensis TaxID=1144680 RepID=A0A934V9B9_9BACT|nr:hypothetical protein [Luteolibacter yonseiensis]MBK1818167.1 hypothetical protein [Luteolibacter yonseiensis]